MVQYCREYVFKVLMECISFLLYFFVLLYNYNVEQVVMEQSSYTTNDLM